MQLAKRRRLNTRNTALLQGRTPSQFDTENNPNAAANIRSVRSNPRVSPLLKASLK